MAAAPAARARSTCRAAPSTSRRTKCIRKGKTAAGQVLQAGGAEVSFEIVEGIGRFRVAETDRSLTVGELAVTLRREKLPGFEDGLDSDGMYQGTASTFPNGCHVCEVEIDPETGIVDVVSYKVLDDFGRVINPMLVAGQVHGGVVQGIGQALLENCVYDPATGQLLTASFTRLRHAARRRPARHRLRLRRDSLQDQSHGRQGLRRSRHGRRVAVGDECGLRCASASSTSTCRRRRNACGARYRKRTRRSRTPCRSRWRRVRAHTICLPGSVRR